MKIKQKLYCFNNIKGFKKYKIYEISFVARNIIGVTNDIGLPYYFITLNKNSKEYYKNYFKTLPEYRKMKILKIIQNT